MLSKIPFFNQCQNSKWKEPPPPFYPLAQKTFQEQEHKNIMQGRNIRSTSTSTATWKKVIEGLSFKYNNAMTMQC